MIREGDRFLWHLSERRSKLAKKCRKIFAEVGEFTLEVGCGHGHFLAAFAAEFPEELCVGIDLKSKRLVRARRKRERGELTNLHFVQAHVLDFLATLPLGTSITRTFLLFSDPWPKRRHHKHRVMQSIFLHRLAGKAVPGSQLHFRTDHAPYFDWAMKLVDGHTQWVIERGAKWPFEEGSCFQKTASSYASFTAVRLSGYSTRVG